MDLRKHSRIAVDSDCTAQLQLQGHTYDNITVSNLGSDGCCIQVPVQAATGFRNKMLLEGIEFVHSDLPSESIKGKIVWLHSQKGSGQDFVETGIQFSGVPDGYCQEVDRYISALLKFNPRTSM